jgi:hypothetical protein
MRFKEMKAEDRARLLEGHEDPLAPLLEADKDIYDVNCPQCGGTCVKAFDLVRALTTNRAIPRYNMKCTVCSCHFEPITGLVINIGAPQAVDPTTLTPIVNPEGH